MNLWSSVYDEIFRGISLKNYLRENFMHVLTTMLVLALLTILVCISFCHPSQKGLC